MATDEQKMLRRMHYRDIDEACGLIDQMGQISSDVEGILDDLTGTTLQSGAEGNDLQRLVDPLRRARHYLNVHRKACKALERAAREAEAAALEAREQAHEPLPPEEADAEPAEAAPQE